MLKDQTQQGSAEAIAALRRAAEARLKEKPATQPPQTEAEARRLQQELEIHQVELELQNEQLRANQAELEAGLERYRDLFNSAPVGYFNLKDDGTIYQVNPAGARLLGVGRDELLGRRIQLFLAEPDWLAFSQFLQQTFATAVDQTCEIVLPRKDQAPLFVRLEASLSGDGKTCRTMLVDLTERKRTEAVLEARVRLSEYALGHSLDELLTRTLDEAERLTGSTLGFCHFVEADQKTLSLQTWSATTLRNMCSAAGKGRHYAADQAGVWADALRERRPMIHNNYASLPHRQGLPPARATGVRELVVPILRHEQVVALLGVGNKPGNYGPEDVQSVSQLASQAWDIVLAKRAEEEIQRQAALIRSLLDSIPDIVFFKNTEGVCLGCNPAFVEFMGRPRNEIIGKTDHDLFDQEMADGFREQDQQMLALRQPRHNEEWVTYPDGRKTLQDTLKTPFWGPDGKLIGVLGISRDITAQKQAEVALRESEQFLQATLNALSGHLAILDENGIIVAANRSWREFAKANSGNTANLCERANYLAVCDTAAGNGCAEAAAFAAGLRAVMQGRQDQFQMECACDSPDEKRWFLCKVTRFSDGKATFVAVVHDDITERKRTEGALRDSLVEKTTLLQEVHHRVKNNLQIVSSLLNLQAGQVKDVAMLELITVVRNRVGAMALLHENLYQSENLAQLNLPAYVERLCAQLLRAAGPVHGRVRLERQAEPKTVLLGLDQAVPLGLLLNELVTNALKYAFPGDRSGCIRVTLARATPQSVCLTVADDGVGLPATLDPRRTSSLGLRLVSLLTGQLHGTVNFERGPGTTVQILFPNSLPTETPHE